MESSTEWPFIVVLPPQKDRKQNFLPLGDKQKSKLSTLAPTHESRRQSMANFSTGRCNLGRNAKKNQTRLHQKRNQARNRTGVLFLGTIIYGFGIFATRSVR